jgi:hypothetical protein
VNTAGRDCGNADLLADIDANFTLDTDNRRVQRRAGRNR